MSQIFVMVRLKPLKKLMEWCDDAIDWKDETDEYAAKAFRSLELDIEAQPAEYGCKHAMEHGFLCHECGRLV